MEKSNEERLTELKTRVELSTKKQIAYLIGTRTTMDYQKNLEYINENEYLCITKVPIKMLFQGVLNTLQGSTIQMIKEVIIEALELSGLEITPVDQDWYQLDLVVNQEDSWHVKWNIKTFNTKKIYVGEFFEP